MAYFDTFKCIQIRAVFISYNNNVQYNIHNNFFKYFLYDVEMGNKGCGGVAPTA